MTTKHCTRCGEDKPLDAFGVHRSQPDGLNRWCKPCVNFARRNPGTGTRARRTAETTTAPPPTVSRGQQRPEPVAIDGPAILARRPRRVPRPPTGSRRGSNPMGESGTNSILARMTPPEMRAWRSWLSETDRSPSLARTDLAERARARG